MSVTDEREVLHEIVDNETVSDEGDRATNGVFPVTDADDECGGESAGNIFLHCITLTVIVLYFG